MGDKGKAAAEKDNEQVEFMVIGAGKAIKYQTPHVPECTCSLCTYFCLNLG